MERTPWMERKFNFDIPEGWLPNILERLKGTSARINEMVNLLKNEQGNHKPGGKWSIKEHIGHLSDLEELHEGRIDDFLSGKETLRGADVKNEKTTAANHNQKDFASLINEFRIKRDHLISRLQQLDDQTLQFKSIHPRLREPMTPVGMAFFVAEHDDHHLASIREIMSDFITQPS